VWNEIDKADCCVDNFWKTLLKGLLMQDNKVAHCRFYLVLVIALALICGAAIGFARQAPASIARSDLTASGATSDVLQAVSRLRQLPIKRPVKSGFKTHDEIKQVVIRDLDDNTPPEEFEATSKTLVKLGMIPKGFPLRDYVVKLLGEQVAGFYEPKTQEFYLAAWLPLAEQKTVMAHELTHALQDQHFNLRRFEKWPKGDSDAELAVHALIEGEATVVMLEYDLEQRGARLDITRIGSLTDLMLKESRAEDRSRYPILAGAPMVLRENLQFPYVYGVGFVQEILKRRSWQALNSIYDKLPASTEQIMHPERFLMRDDPVRIEIPDLLPALGPDWRRADQDVNGEFGYQILLRQFIDKRTASRGAEGWGGDRYVLYEDKRTGALMIAQYTTWDTETDAREFFNAYSERTEKRYETSSSYQPNLRIYNTDEGLVSIELRNRDVVIIEGARNHQQLARISELLWQSKKW
jgi:hypothetical protein